MSDGLSPQMEDYLEAISHLCAEGGVARVKDIASRIEVKMASVVGAVKALKEKGLVTQEPYGYVRLTEDGALAADSVVRRHRLIAGFLEKVLGLDASSASSDACRIEHAVSPETTDRLGAMAEFLETAVHEDLDWPSEFRKYYRARARRKAR